MPSSSVTSIWNGLDITASMERIIHRGLFYWGWGDLEWFERLTNAAG